MRGLRTVTKSPLGACTNNEACTREWRRRFYAADPEPRRAATRKWTAANRAVLRESHRQYLRRPDRPCRYAKLEGCTEYSIAGAVSCRKHHNAETVRRARRRRARLGGQLAAAQDWTCTWCSGPLPRDLGSTEVDHIVPRARGGPDETWNYQVLHTPCNREKRDSVTPRALELAAEHDITLTGFVVVTPPALLPST